MWSHANPDNGLSVDPSRFEPALVPGVQLLEDVRTRVDYHKYLILLVFFQLFFTLYIVQRLCNWTHDYAKLHGP